MDKRVIFAVAGSGKTTYIVDSLSRDKRSLIVTYTVGNYNNLCRKISEKFNGDWPENIWVMGYFTRKIPITDYDNVIKPIILHRQAIFIVTGWRC